MTEQLVDFVIFETERLYIREFNIDDVESVYAYAGDAENTFFMPWGPESYDGTKNFVCAKLKSQLSEPRVDFDFAVCLKSTGELIGSMGLTLDEKRTQGELGYILKKTHWRKGYASEAARAFLKFGFMSLDLHRISARCDGENLASESVMKKIGMRKEAEFRSSCFTIVNSVEQWRDEKVYAMLQTEFLKSLFK